MMNQSITVQACFQISFPGPSVPFQTRFSKALSVSNMEEETEINIAQFASTIQEYILLIVFKKALRKLTGVTIMFPFGQSVKSYFWEYSTRHFFEQRGKRLHHDVLCCRALCSFSFHTLSTFHKIKAKKKALAFVCCFLFQLTCCSF